MLQTTIKSCVAFLVFSFGVSVPLQGEEDINTSPATTLTAGDRALVAESLSALNALGSDYFPFWLEAPTDMMLLTESAAFYIADWQPDALSPLNLTISGRMVSWRPRQLSANLLATFPVFDGARPTIVMGAPNMTEQTAAQWMATVIHEHVHQVQMSRPGYSERTNALGLGEDGDNGMWMINFPFPYQDADVNAAFNRLGKALVNANNGVLSKASNRDARVEAYLTAKQDFFDVVGERNARYFEFQLWQEGLARYLEYRGARHLAALGVSALDTVASDLYQGAANSLRSADTLMKLDRSAIYMVGLLEGTLLEALNPGWERDYFTGDMSTTRLLQTAID